MPLSNIQTAPWLVLLEFAERLLCSIWSDSCLLLISQNCWEWRSFLRNCLAEMVAQSLDWGGHQRRSKNEGPRMMKLGWVFKTTSPQVIWRLMYTLYWFVVHTVISPFNPPPPHPPPHPHPSFLLPSSNKPSFLEDEKSPPYTITQVFKTQKISIRMFMAEISLKKSALEYACNYVVKWSVCTHSIFGIWQF